MKSLVPGMFLLLTLFIAATPLFSQAVTERTAPPPPLMAWAAGPEDQEGPDHAIYKKGYDLVLSEKWNDAQKLFAELTAKYPKSEYTDDARYWYSYALMHTNLKKALASYEEFLEKYPKSSYIDDAMADMHSIQAQLEVARATGMQDSAHAMIYRAYLPRVGARASRAPHAFRLDRNMRNLERSVRLLNKHTGRLNVYSLNSVREEKEIDAKTQLKLDALQAIAENTRDEKGFVTLKEIALDVKQPLVLRKEALSLLSGFEDRDVDAVYLDVVRKDTSEEMQVIAIENLGTTGKNKEKTVETLVNLYTSLPKAKEDQRSTTLYRIADIGNDRAVDFLGKVARSDTDYDMRSDAVYYLGNIGGDKARDVLYDILKGE